MALPNPVLALSPDGRTLATNRVAMLDQEQILAGKEVPVDPSAKESLNDVKLWDAASGKEKFTLRGHTGPVSAVVFSPAGTTLATVGKDKTLRVWDAATGEARAKVELGNPFAGSVLFTPNGGAILTADARAVATLWDAKTGRVQATLEGTPGNWCRYAFSPDGRALATAVGGGPPSDRNAGAGAAVPIGAPVEVKLWHLTDAPPEAKPAGPPPEPKPAPPQEKPAAKPGTPGAEYEGLRNEYFEYLGTYTDAYHAAKTDAERDKLQKEMLARRVAVVTRILDLARRHPAEPFAVEALALVVQLEMAPASAPDPLRRRNEALDLLLSRHVESDGLAALFSALSFCPTDEGDAFLRAVLDRGKKVSVRGEACLTLGHSRMKRAENARLVRANPDLAKRVAGSYGEDVLRRLRESDSVVLDREAEKLFDRVKADFGDVKAGRDTLGAKAEAALFALRNLAVGSAAPEIEGKDTEDKGFKLSDYRGKVVVTFSGNWCGPCRAMYPHERKLVERLKGKPFAALSVNTDPKKETLEDAIKKGEITWRCWWDGSDGPIAKKWNIQGFPAVFVLDHRGVIRHKEIRDEKDLDAAVETLLRELEAGGEKPPR